MVGAVVVRHAAARGGAAAWCFCTRALPSVRYMRRQWRVYARLTPPAHARAVVFVRAGLDPTTFKRRAGSDHAPAAGMTVSPTYRRRDVTFWAQRFWDFTPVALMLVAAKLTTYGPHAHAGGGWWGDGSVVMVVLWWCDCV